MGMNDPKEPYEPKYEPIRCDVTGKMFAPVSVRSCPEPHVIKRYGVGGECKVSVYICRKCRFGRREKLLDGWRCVYGLE